MEDTTVAALIVLVLFAVTEIIITLVERSASKPNTEEEIMSMVNDVHEQGVIEDSEAKMINNIFDFADKEVGEIMTNRSNIVSIDKGETLEHAIKFMLDNSNSRYPVYEENLDHVLGMLYLKDAMRFKARGTDGDKPVSEIKGLIRKALFVPETMNINDLFKTMQFKKTQLAMVVDEYGQTVGLVAMEDILEEIVGNIMDEYDVEEKHIRKTGKDSYVIDGITPISEVEDVLGIEFNVEDFDTMNGFMISRLEHLPVKGENFKTELGGYEFSILSVDNRKVAKISVRKTIKKDEEQ